MKEAGFSFIAIDTTSTTLSLYGLAFFLALVVFNVIYRFKPLFLSQHGWSHRLAGGALLAWLVVGTWNVLLLALRENDVTSNSSSSSSSMHLLWWWLGYDTVLGLLGITTTLTAARDFPHKYVKNAQGQSGSLSQKALVTQAEMIEHSFYQGLNLWQAWYLYYVSTIHHHSSSTTTGWLSQYTITRIILQPLTSLWIMTSPWLIRCHWPVHSFSHNWKVTPEAQRTNQEVVLYQIKKSQYLFYKHVLLHGLNIYMALEAMERIVPDGNSSSSNNNNNNATRMATSTLSWRIYWLALNTSYVMEFFLQTLVRRNLLSLKGMFLLQQLLMGVSSIAAVQILLMFMLAPDDSKSHVFNMTLPAVCLVSLLLNFTNRGHDVLNVMMTAMLFYGLQQL